MLKLWRKLQTVFNIHCLILNSPSVASPTQWTWIWANCRSLWRTEEPGMLQSMGLQSWTWLKDWTAKTMVRKASSFSRFSTTLVIFLCLNFRHPSCCSVTKSCSTMCDPMDCSNPGFPVLHCLPQFVQTPVHWVSDAIHLSHPLSHPSLLALNLAQHQDLFQWVSSLYQVAKLLEFQLQHQSFQWIFRVDIL